MFKVTWVEIDSLLSSGWRDVKKKVFSQIAVRIDEADSMALLNELEDEIAKERCFSRTRLPDDVGVIAGISQLETERHLAAPRLPHSDVKVIIHAHAAQASRRSMN
jgi:hypothetical protein